MPAGILSAFIFCLLTLSSACYLQNCPQGRKRSVPEVDMENCRPCGPENTGMCICCPENKACLHGLGAKMSCRRKKSLNFPCQVS
uniref:Uncharacterized protein n=1 Tax=Naja naja TaxID=35670 RepID=A0A8C6Y2U5_NAJNA